MILTSEPIQSSDLVNLAPLECLCSCVLTGLKLAGLDHRLFLARCWDVQFYDGFLLSARELREYEQIDALYGTRSFFAEEGSMEQLEDIFSDGGLAYYACFASALPYFPKAYLQYESSGLTHCIILKGFDPASGLVSVIDPMVGYTGEITVEQLLQATPRPGAFMYFYQFFPAEPAQHAGAQAFAEAAQRNLSAFRADDAESGANALRRFREQAADSLHWEEARRSFWIAQNNITISALCKMRTHVWESLQSFGVMNEAAFAEGSGRLQDTIQQWSALNFLLLKYKRNAKNAALVDAMGRKLEDIRQAEERFLTLLPDIEANAHEL